jgi:hypothetical protein
MKKPVNIFIIMVTIGVAVASYIVIEGDKAPAPQINLNTKNMENLKIKSSAFEEGGSIPAKYTCDGESVSLPLEIGGVPDGTKSLALVMYDPDIPESAKKALGVDIFVHWIKWNILATTTSIKEGVEPDGVSGKGGSGKLAYVGPCPPDREHRYFINIYALDTKIDLAEGSGKEALEAAMQGHVLAAGELMGKYDRVKN